MRQVCVLLTVLFLAGCATFGWQKAPEKEYRDSKNSFTATINSAWMFLSGNSFVMTKDGIVLDCIQIERVKFTDKLAYTKKKFTSSMLPEDLAEVEIDNYQSNQENFKFEVLDKQATNISGQEAYLLSYRYQTKSGLWKKGKQYGFIYKSTVYRIIYEAAEQYYYQENEKVFEQFINSLRLI